MLSGAIDKLDNLQQQASDASQQLATGQATDISQVTMQVENASLALQLAVEVRNKAVDAYRSFASNPQASLPRDQALMSAAETLEDARRFAEARAAYKQLAEEFPASLFAAQARARADYLAVEG